MQLTLANHPITDLQFGAPARLDGTVLVVDADSLSRVVLQDPAFVGVHFEIARPGEPCRAGPIFAVIEPRATAPAGAAVSVLAEISPDLTRSATGRVLEMSGAPADASDYANLHHLLVIPQTKPGLSRQAVEKAYRLAGLRVAVALARLAATEAPESVMRFEPVGPAETGREGLPRVAYVGQIFSRQRKPEVDEPILYGANTDGMLPVVLHPDEWLDGAVVPSLHSWSGGTETYFYQNHPIILDLY